MLINLYLKSKNPSSVKKLYALLIITCKFYNVSLYRNCTLPTICNKFSILKSPHVNKSSQEQFQYKLHRKKLSFHSKNLFKILLFIKSLRKKTFTDVSFKIEFILSNTNKTVTVHSNKNFKKSILSIDTLGESYLLKVNRLTSTAVRIAQFG